jgi:sigma-B regulation protein RsbU (phosphoserine phosphatase)
VVWGEGLVGWVADHAQAVVVNDVDSDTRYRCVEVLEETLSELAAPLILDDELLGVLDIQSDQPNAFGPDDLYIMETLGGQVALAIQGARLYEAERQQAWFSTALLQVAESMSRLSDMDAVLATIVRLTPLLAGVDRCAILLWEEDIETFVPAQTYGLSAELRETFERTRFTSGTMLALDLLLLEKAPLQLNATRDAPLIPADLAETYEIQDMLLLPLLAQGELQGAMMVDYAGAAHTFGEQMTHMLAGIANQAATVIQSARLMRAQQEEAYVSMALLQVSEVVSRSTDLDEIMEAIVRITPMLVGVERCAIVVWNAPAAAFLPVQQYGLDEQTRQEFWRLRLTREEAPMRELVAGEPFVVLQDSENPQPNGGSGIPFTVVDTPRLMPYPGKSLLMALPMVTKGGVVGAMFVDVTGPEQHFTQRWLSILVGIAGQAAIAVENDRLLGEAAEQERTKQELEFARRIQASFLPDRSPYVPGWELATVWRPARQVAGDFYDFIMFAPGTAEPGRASKRLGLVIADVADKGVPAALYMALSRTLVRTVAIDGRPPAEAIARANDLILADARSDLFVTLLYAIVEPDTGVVRYVNAGHMPPLLVRAAGGEVEELRDHGMALGVLPGLEFEEQTAQLAPGDTLVLYTDGVTEAWNSEQEMFERERLIELVGECQSLSAGALAEAISDAVAAFVGDAPQADDLTLMVVKRVQ